MPIPLRNKFFYCHTIIRVKPTYDTVQAEEHTWTTCSWRNPVPYDSRSQSDCKQRRLSILLKLGVLSLSNRARRLGSVLPARCFEKSLQMKVCYSKRISL